ERVPPSEFISAADIEKFGYCPLSWWLSRELAPEEGPELAEGEKKHEAASADLKGIEAHEAKAREAETGVLYFAIAASIVAIVGVKFLSSESVQVAYTLGAIALIWLLAAVYFLYRAETLATQAEKLLSERVILGFAMAAAVIATAAVSFTGVVNQSLALGFVALAGRCSPTSSRSRRTASCSKRSTARRRRTASSGTARRRSRSSTTTTRRSSSSRSSRRCAPRSRRARPTGTTIARASASTAPVGAGVRSGSPKAPSSGC